MVGEKNGCGQLQIVKSVIKHIDKLNRKLQNISNIEQQQQFIHPHLSIINFGKQSTSPLMAKTLPLEYRNL
uniref:BHLH domain-containing protein n=1 Tax=Meloidogyne hapla TaxID=6305 RepID=A0A1I8B830_MELHA